MLSQYNRWCILILIFEICLFLFLFSLLFLRQFYLPPVQHFILTWGKSNKDIYHLSPNVAGNILITICLLWSSASSQHHFQNWLSVLRCNSDRVKLEWVSLLFNFTWMRDLSNKDKLFSSPVAKYASFSHQVKTLKTDLLQFNIKFSWILSQNWHILPPFLFFTCRSW